MSSPSRRNTSFYMYESKIDIGICRLVACSARIDTHTHTDTQDQYSNPAAHAHRGLTNAHCVSETK